MTHDTRAAEPPIPIQTLQPASLSMAKTLLREIVPAKQSITLTAPEAIQHTLTTAPGSPIAFILPLTAVSGGTNASHLAADNWHTFRHTILESCDSIKVITVAAYDVTPGKLSSAALLTAIRRHPGEETDHTTILHVNIHQEPRTHAEAQLLARRIKSSAKTQTPGTTFRWDPSKQMPGGHATLAVHTSGQPWRNARILDPHTLLAADALHNGQLGPRFRFSAVPSSTLLQLTTGAVKDRHAALILLTSNIRWNTSRMTAHATTNIARPPRAFIAAIPTDRRHRDAIAAWLNSTMGLLTLWQTATHIHNGRSYLNLGNLRDMPIPDLTAMNPATIHALNEIHRQLDASALLTASDSWQDTTRAELDRRLLEAMGADQEAHTALAAARIRWCLEPTVQGRHGIAASKSENMTRLRAEAAALNHKGGFHSVITSKIRNTARWLSQSD